MKGVIEFFGGTLPELLAEGLIELIHAKTNSEDIVQPKDWFFAGEFVPEELVSDPRFEGCSFFIVGHDDFISFANLLRYRARKDLAVYSMDENLDVQVVRMTSNVISPLHNICDLLQLEMPGVALGVCQNYRSKLRKIGGRLNANLYSNLASVHSCCDFIYSFHNAYFSGDGRALSRRELSRDLQEFLSTVRSKYIELQKTSPAFAESFSRYSYFLKQGEELFRYSKISSWQESPIFLWLTVFFIRGAKRFEACSEGSQSIAFLTRSLESYGLYKLIQNNRIAYDGDSVYHEGKRVEGAGRIFALVLDFGLLGFIDQDTSDKCTEVIKLRNKSLYGHGVQNLERNLLQGYIKAVVNLISSREKITITEENRWNELWDTSQSLGDGGIIDISLDLTVSEMMVKR